MINTIDPTTNRPAAAVAPLDFGALGPTQVIERASEIANTLRDLISRRRLFVDIDGKKHVVVEAWTTLAAMLGIVPREVETVQHAQGYTSKVELVRTHDGAVVGGASAYCGADELRWKHRPLFARRSMAITRATSKACRISFSWIITLAGYDPTPAEEMDHLANEPRHGNDSINRDTVQRSLAQAETLQRLERGVEVLQSKLQRGEITQAEWKPLWEAIGTKARELALASMARACSKVEIDSICAAVKALGVREEKLDEIRRAASDARSRFRPSLKPVKDDAAMARWRGSVPQECMSCEVGEEETPFGLSVHHLIRRSRLRLDVPWNFLLLCQPCHRRCEGQFVQLNGQRFKPLSLADQLWLKWRRDPKNYRRDLLRNAYGPTLPRSKRPRHSSSSTTRQNGAAQRGPAARR